MEDVSYEPSEEKLLIVEQFCVVFGAEWKGKSRILRAKRGKNKVNNAENVGFILHPAWILHPILHPKSPINKGDFKDWCRKCRRKTQNFFWRRGFGNPKTSDFFEANLRTFEAKHRNFTLKKSDVFGFRTDSNHRRWHFVLKRLTMTDFTSQIICYFTTSLHIFCNVFLRCFTGFVCCS